MLHTASPIDIEFHSVDLSCGGDFIIAIISGQQLTYYFVFTVIGHGKER